VNAKQYTQPELIVLLRAAATDAKVGASHRDEMLRLADLRSFARRDKEKAAQLLSKYDYISKPERFLA
jgi:hypothetical protein